MKFKNFVMPFFLYIFVKNLNGSSVFETTCEAECPVLLLYCCAVIPTALVLQARRNREGERRKERVTDRGRAVERERERGEGNRHGEGEREGEEERER